MSLVVEIILEEVMLIWHLDPCPFPLHFLASGLREFHRNKTNDNVIRKGYARNLCHGMNKQI